MKAETPAIREIGDRFGRFEVYLPELILAGDAMKAAVDVLTVEMRKRGTAMKTSGKVLIGTVEGDVHDIGKNLVGSLLVANGFEVIDLGVDVPARDFVRKAQAEQVDIVAALAADDDFVFLSAAGHPVTRGTRLPRQLLRYRRRWPGDGRLGREDRRGWVRTDGFGCRQPLPEVDGARRTSARKLASSHWLNHGER